jgi:hypothetical protein
MNKVECWFAAAACDGSGLFCRTLMVSFVPAPGSRVSFETGGESWQVWLARWDKERQVYVCNVGAVIDLRVTWERLKGRYLRQGWHLKKERPRPHGTPGARRPRWLADCRGEG